MNSLFGRGWKRLVPRRRALGSIVIDLKMSTTGS